MDPEVKSFFDLEPAGVEFVFNLNFLGVLLPTQVFAQDMLEKKEGGYPQHLLHERLYAFDQDSRLLRGQGRGEQLHPVAGGALRGHGHPV